LLSSSSGSDCGSNSLRPWHSYYRRDIHRWTPLQSKLAINPIILLSTQFNPSYTTYSVQFKTMLSSAFPQERKEHSKEEQEATTVRQLPTTGLGDNPLLDILQLSTLRNSALLNHHHHQRTVSTATGATAAVEQGGSPTNNNKQLAAAVEQATNAQIAHLASLSSSQQEGVHQASVPRISVMNGNSQAPPQVTTTLDTTSNGSVVPTIPFMIHPEICGLSMQEIAKEAMRIAKESIRKQQEEALATETGLIHKTHAPPSAVPNSSKPATSAAAAGSAPTTPTAQSNKQAVVSSPPPPSSTVSTCVASLRLNKFVRRLHDMVKSEQDKGIVEWRRGLLVLHSTATFAKTILPKFFNTRNFKTFRRQLNYYGFVHVRSFSNTAASTTTALWVHQELAATLHGMASTTTTADNPDDLMHILKLRRVEPNEDHKTVEGRRQRKELALYTVEEDLQVSTKSLQRQQIQSLLSMSSAAGLADVPTSPASGARPTARVPAAATTATSSTTTSLPAARAVSVTTEAKSASHTSGVPTIISDPEDEHKQAGQVKTKSPSSASSTKKKKRKSPSSTSRPQEARNVKKSDCRRYVSDGSVASLTSASNKSVTTNHEEEQEEQKAKSVTREDSAANLLLLLSRGS